MTSRVLITGINGFVGRHIAKELLTNKDIKIMGFDRNVNVSGRYQRRSQD